MNESKNLTDRLASMTEDRQYEQETQQVEAVPEQIEAAPEQTETVQDQSETVEPIVQPQNQKEGGHFKKLRESLEKSEREKEQLYEILFKMQQPVQPVQKEQVESESEFEDNDFVPRNYVDRKLRETQQQLHQYQQALYEQTVTGQLQAQYTDFSQILSKDNIAKLRQEHPEIAASLASNPDIASKAQATYKIIKKLGLDKEQENYEPVKKKIESNAQKPRPAVATPLSYASSYDYQRMSDDEMRRERLAMEQAIKDR